MIYWPQKDPGVSLVFGVDWAPSLRALADDEIITDSAWEVVSGSVTFGSEYFDDTTTAIRISGGVDDEEQILRNTITTNNANTIVTLCYMLVKDLG